jgi:two-component system LytT family response regulator
MIECPKKLRLYLVDDELLALKRLTRLLVESNKAEIVKQSTDPREALSDIPKMHLDAVFLDIQMPDLNGFEMLGKLDKYPPIVFTTAFDKYALKAFEVYSIDYLLKPIESERLERTLCKLENILWNDRPTEPNNLKALMENFAPLFNSSKVHTRTRLPSRIGGKVRIIDVAEITCFHSEDKLTLAQDADGQRFPLDFSLNELVGILDPHTFLRIHRSAVVNLKYVDEIHGWFSGKVLLRLKDAKKTDLVVARDRVKVLKIFLGM